jgi:hypothetical protein
MTPDYGRTVIALLLALLVIAAILIAGRPHSLTREELMTPTPRGIKAIDAWIKETRQPDDVDLVTPPPQPTTSLSPSSAAIT